MLVFTAKVSKGKILAIALLIVVIIGLLISLCTKAEDTPDQEDPAVTVIETNDDRVAFLQSQGWQVEATPVETQQVNIPETLPAILEQYNKLQQAQGYNLMDYAGKTVQRFVYAITNYPDTTDSYFATILVYDNQVIAGDVASASQEGLMQGLAYPKTN